MIYCSLYIGQGLVCVSYDNSSGVCVTPQRLEVTTVLSENALSAPAIVRRLDFFALIDSLRGKTSCSLKALLLVVHMIYVINC